MNSDTDRLAHWLVSGLELDTTIFHVGQYCGPWRASTAGRERASFHLVLRGQSWLHLEGQAPILLREREGVFFLRDIPHCLTPEAVVDASFQPRAMLPMNPPQPGACGLACGFFQFKGLLGELFTNGQAEVSLYWTDADTGVDCRARVDWLREDMIVDLKTARYGSGTADAFGRYAASYNYPLPAAVYVEAVETLVGKTLPFITVTVETEPPYLVRAYRYTDADLDQGLAQWHEALREYAKRDAANDWTVPAEIDLIALPAWYAPLEDLEF